ncbi:MAG TPA: MBL fold metallo-hydrolase [Solirubrobacterales bacterium]|nr:MBL fold metallo-hydrolase [Solirubrobacterales bacterium]
MPRLIDTMYLGRDRVIGAHFVRGLIVDPGPSSALDNWIDELEEEPHALLLTHIHLDHAGAAGVLARRFPGLRIYVSEIGAPHVVDPRRLLASAGRLYGPENMEYLWGEVAPVEEGRIVALAGGEEVEGFRVLHTPGHASHHLCFFDLETGDAYVGDMAGVRIPPSDYTVPPTPPPEIDVETWLASVDAIEAMSPSALHLTHFGAAEPGAQLDRVRGALRRNAELARAGEREAFLETIARETEANNDTQAAASLRQAAPPEQLWLGLERYWRKRDG